MGREPLEDLIYNDTAENDTVTESTPTAESKQSEMSEPVEAPAHLIAKPHGDTNPKMNVHRHPKPSVLKDPAYQSNAQEVSEEGIYSIPKHQHTLEGRTIVAKKPLEKQSQKSVRSSPHRQFRLNSTKVTSTPSFNSCLTIPELGRYVPSGRAFEVQYSLRIGSMPFPDRIMVRAAQPIVMKFVIKPLIDIGGTLKFDMTLLKDDWVRTR